MTATTMGPRGIPTCAKCNRGVHTMAATRATDGGVDVRVTCHGAEKAFTISPDQLAAGAPWPEVFA